MADLDAMRAFNIRTGAPVATVDLKKLGAAVLNDCKYGVDVDGQSQTFTQLGEKLGITKERVRQIEQRALAKLREVTNNYTLPADACPTFRAMYEELQRMEADLHQHIHLENNILFPRAIELEGRLGENG